MADPNIEEALDTIWMLVCGCLVFFMHTGFLLVESGTVRAISVQHILGKNLLVLTIGFLCWYFMGFPLAAGIPDNDPTKFAGSTHWAMGGMWKDRTEFRSWWFGGTFAATAATIVSGAMAERANLGGFVLFTILLLSVIYPIGAYWAWSGQGWLNYTGDDGEPKSKVGPPLQDFAGSGVVHMVGGVAALVGAIVVGPREGRFYADCAHQFHAHNVPFVVLGTLFLWFGWFGFNGGSTLSMKSVADASLAGVVIVNTTLSPAVSGLTVFCLRAVVLPPRKLDVTGFCNSILAGLVGITAGCAFVYPWEAMLIGFFSAFVYQGSAFLLQKLQIDDVVEASVVHGFCGLWGLLAPGFFGEKDNGLGGNGVFYGGDQLGVQVVAAIVYICWTLAWSVPAFGLLRVVGLLRVSDGLHYGVDAAEHHQPNAYNIGRAVIVKE